MGGDGHQSLNEERGDWEFPSGKELGPLLRDKRKELGLTYAQVCERIKVSARYLEALENEDWERLPSPTFVKGFIRSYAGALGLSAEGLVGLYQEIAPRPQPMPKPLQRVTRRKKGPLYLFLVFAVLAGGLAVYDWIEDPALSKKATERSSMPPADERPTDEPIVRNIQLDKEAAPQADAEHTPGPLAPDRKLPQEDPVPGEGDTEVSDKKENKPAEAPSPQSVEQDASLKATRPAEPETSPPAAVSSPDSDRPPLILKASIRERTWVRVIIDNEKPKEYILGPDSRPEWRAHKGFELLIGNAGGIDLELNGKKMEDLGKPGQVIRLRLPSGYERNALGE